tara:strand:- start:2032 stop:5679 length:3648 start_codon:yes stop_codon:yes gene_type:complete
MPDEYKMFLQSIAQPSGSNESIYNRRDVIEPHMNRETEGRFWYQDLILRAIQNNNLEKGCLFYHGMGTGKTCLYTKYIRNSILNHRYFRNIYIVVSRKLSKNVEKELYSDTCGQSSLRDNPNLIILTYHEFEKMKVVLFNDLVIIDESHQILESNANVISGDNIDEHTGSKSEKKHDRYTRILLKANNSINSVFLLFDGTPIQTHEVDLVNLIRLTNKDVNEYISHLSGIDTHEYIDSGTFDRVFSNQKVIGDLVKIIGKNMSFLQLPNEIPRNFKENEKFHISRDGVVIFSHLDMKKFGNLYLTEMSPSHLRSYKENVSSTSNKERKNLGRKAITLKDESVPTGVLDSIELDVSTIDGEDTTTVTTGGVTGLSLFMRELVFSQDELFRSLRKAADNVEKMRVLKEHSPIIWSILSHICGEEEDSKESGTCMIYSQYKTGIFDGGGVLRTVLKYFGFVNLKATATETDSHQYKRFLYLETPADFNFLDTHVNIPENVMGKVVRVLFLSPMASEGFSIYNCQQVHVLCPDHGLFFKTDQAISRGVRLGRHDQLIELFEKQGKVFDKVDVFLHATIFSDPTHFPYNLAYYIKMYFEDVRIKAFERMCMQEAIDCRFLKVMNENSPDQNGIRTCNYLSCNIYCNEKIPDNLKLDQKHLINSFYDFNRTNIDIIKAWVKEKLWKYGYLCVDYEQFLLSQTTRPENLLVFQNTIQVVIKYWDGQLITIGVNRYIVQYFAKIDCLVLLPKTHSGFLDSYPFMSKYIHSTIMPLNKSMIEHNTGATNSSQTKHGISTEKKRPAKISTYSKRLEYELPLPFTWQIMTNFFNKLHRALFVMSQEDDITSKNSWWYLIMTSETPTIPASLKIKIIDKQKQLEFKMGGADRFVTDVYTYVIKKCMTKSACGIEDNTDVAIAEWTNDNLPVKSQSFYTSIIADIAQKQIWEVTHDEWHGLIMKYIDIYLQNYLDLQIMMTIANDVSQKIQKSDNTNSATTGKINKLAALQNLIHFLSIGSNGQSSANTTASKTDKLEVVPEPLRAMLAALICEFSEFSEIYTDDQYFRKLLVFVNTRMISFHLSFIPKEFLACVLKNVANLAFTEHTENVTYKSIKDLFSETDTNPSGTRITHSKTNKSDIHVPYIEALDDLFLNYALLYRYYKQQVLSTVLGTVCQNKVHLKESGIDMSFFPGIQKCSQLWTHLINTDDPRVIFQGDYPHFKNEKE